MDARSAIYAILRLYNSYLVLMYAVCYSHFNVYCITDWFFCFCCFILFHFPDISFLSYLLSVPYQRRELPLLDIFRHVDKARFQLPPAPSNCSRISEDVTYSVRLLKPTCGCVKARANSRMWLNSIPLAFSNSSNFWQQKQNRIHHSLQYCS